MTNRVARFTSILTGSEKTPLPSFQKSSMVKKFAVTRSRSPSSSRSADSMELARTPAGMSVLVKTPSPWLLSRERVELVSAFLFAVTRSLSPSPSKSPEVSALGKRSTVRACSRSPNCSGANSHSSGMPFSLQSALVAPAMSTWSSTPLRLQSTARADPQALGNETTAVSRTNMSLRINLL